MELAGIFGSGLSLMRSRACRPCLWSEARCLLVGSTGVGTSGGVETATVVTKWYLAGRLLSRADVKAHDEPDSWVVVLEESLSPVRSTSLGRGATGTLADAMDDEMHCSSSSLSSTAQSPVKDGSGRGRE